MYLPGHIALSYLSSRYLKAELKVAIIAGVFPDVFDKVSYYLLKLTPDARIPAHTLAGSAEKPCFFTRQDSQDLTDFLFLPFFYNGRKNYPDYPVNPVSANSGKLGEEPSRQKRFV